MLNGLRQIAVMLSLALGVLSPARASAHDPFEVTADAHLDDQGLNVHSTLSLDTAARACLPGAARERRLRAADFPQFRAEFERCARAFFALSAGPERLALRSLSLQLSVENDLEMRLVYAPPRRSPLLFEALGLHGLNERAGVLLTVTGNRSFLGQKLLRPDDARLELPITEEGEALGTPLLPTFGGFLRLGIEHILGSADHFLFLLGLLVVCRRLRTVAILISCFTVAHSITLALAVLELVTLPARVVEPLIAASIVWVGLENLYLGQEPEGRWLSRWLLTFAFGLVHGLGFADALRGAGLGSLGSSLWPQLLAFNLGVELGQIAVASALLALLWRFSKLTARVRLPQLVSIAITLLGLVWLVQRMASRA